MAQAKADILMNANVVYGMTKQVNQQSGSEISTEANLLYGLRQTPAEEKVQGVKGEEEEEDYEN